MKPYFVDGAWKTGPETFQVLNPWSGKEIAIVSMANREHVQNALAAAEKAFFKSRCQSPLERSDILTRAAKGIRERVDEFASLIVQEAGKPISLAETEVQRAVITFEFAAAEAQQLSDEEIPLAASPAGMGHQGFVRQFPIGIILGITPFNFPLNLVAHKVAPAIASGNCILLKPSPRTPLSALLLAEVLHASGVPAGQVNVVPFDHSLVKSILADPRIRMVSFTGSADVGWNLKASLPVRTKVILELGGNAAVIVESDSNWQEAIPAIATSAFGFAGQSCISTQRILVQESIYESFRESLNAHITNAVRSGDPQLRETLVGPLIDSAARDRILTWVQQTVSEGATLLTPLVSRELSLLEPILLENVPKTSPLECREVFGPVATLRPYANLSEALLQVNASDFGLHASVFTGSPEIADFAFDHLETAAVLINEVPSFRVENMPYGGLKASGWGREGIRYAMQEMMEPKLRIVRVSM